MAFKETTADPMCVASERTKELYELGSSVMSKKGQAIFVIVISESIMGIFSRLFESKESRDQRMEAQRHAEQAEIKKAAEEIHAKRLAEQAEVARRAEAMKNRKLNWTDEQMLNTLRRLCNAYAQDDTSAISKLEPLATEIGKDLNIVGGIEEMRRIWNKLGNMRGSRTLDMHWVGIGDWRG